jgi:7,8-dihydropterin-6-yl-methyl-4-(beta-D-ribofuranosyl)aminobenzene 5'-phosphate synthase
MGWTPQTTGKSGPSTLTVLFDNYPFQGGCATGWGFAALIEGFEKTILFDTGGFAPDILQKNFEALKIDPARIDLVVISHNHFDHTGGLPFVLKRRAGLPVYVPFSANPAFTAIIKEAGGKIVAAQKPQTLAQGVMTTGDLGEAVHEQALVLDTSGGLVVVTGCAHPGIVRMLEKIKETRKKDIGMVLGGFHLLETAPAEVDKIIARLKELGVQRVGATHCTGDAAIGMFRKAYGSNFVELGVGRKVVLSPSD